MEYTSRVFRKHIDTSAYTEFILGGDIGGTNTNLAVAGVKNDTPELLFSHHFKTQTLSSLAPAVNTILNYAENKFNISLTSACFAAAGVISADQKKADLTNVSWNISSDHLQNKTPLNMISLINDFQAIGYGINLLDPSKPEDFRIITKGDTKNPQKHASKAIVGAGTGLGKSILIYDNHLDMHLPTPSEGGHADFPIYDEVELDLITSIQNTAQQDEPISYEDILSGNGLERIYMYVRKSSKFPTNKYIQEIDAVAEKAPLISKYRRKDATCKETFQLFTRFYARCCKNLVLDTFALGGLYIAGGIASKNSDIFTSKVFKVEFENAYQRSDVLRSTPIYLIKNYDVSLYGASLAGVLHKKT